MTDEELEGIRTNMQRYAEIGVEVHVTELDIKCPWDNNEQKCTHDSWTDDEIQK